MDKKTLGAYHAADLKTRREIEKFIYCIDDPQTLDMFYLPMEKKFFKSMLLLTFNGLLWMDQ